VRVWRLCSRRHRAFDGEGARLHGGRWNHRGTRVVYTSESLSLAALEYFVNLDPDLLPPDLVAIPAEVPEAVRIQQLAIRELPRNWRETPSPEALQDLGTAWASRRVTAVLAVPSAVVPQERNFLLNPAHPDFQRIRIGEGEPFRLDPRLWKHQPG
jgi:RES domain-containing protein